jgi:glycosyltransferase involved in cell wall biosynthesis
VPGVDVIGDFAATTGLIEAGRRLVLAAASTGIDVEITDVELPLPKSPVRQVRQLDEIPRGRRHDIELWCVNVNELRHIDESMLRPPGGRRRHVIAVWFWEAPSLPTWALGEIDRVDEIWVASRFVRNAFRAATDRPTVIVPCVVDPVLPPRPERSDYGLPDDALLFFFNFDAGSSDARKNPWGIIRAFASAFSDEERRGPVRLVFKTQNLDVQQDLRAELETRIGHVNGIIIDGELPRDRMNGLLAAVDVYVSLHRAEGFGLGIAEAMCLGKPAIVTAYSGNIDFTTRANSCLVGYTLRRIDESDHRLTPHGNLVYEPGLIWAEPRIDQAARWMRYLYDHPAERARIGEAGAATIRERFGPRTVAGVVANRLKQIRAARAPTTRSTAPERLAR